MPGPMTPPVEKIAAGGRTLALIVRGGTSPDMTRFVTPAESELQVGYVVRPASGAIRPHRHRLTDRRITGTGEVLYVLRGRCEADFYDGDPEPIATRELCTGDLLVLTGAGHGFRMLEDTTFLEVKQGPFSGDGEKEFIT
ncbi:MAG: hypothetical protein FLDDKLPJ_00457 [Phycisphaerae bacterium]|nr:hypothetical protein [Phycisphaerae bacterium]